MATLEMKMGKNHFKNVDLFFSIILIRDLKMPS